MFAMVQLVFSLDTHIINDDSDTYLPAQEAETQASHWLLASCMAASVMYLWILYECVCEWVLTCKNTRKLLPSARQLDMTRPQQPSVIQKVLFAHFTPASAYIYA